MGCMVSHLTLYRTSKLLFWVDSIFYSFSHQCVRSPGAPHSHWEDSYWVFNFMGVCWYLTAALIRASFRTTDVEHLLMRSLAICRVLWNGPSSLSPIKKCGLFLLLLWDFFTYPGAGLYQIYKIFSSSLWLFKFFCTSVLWKAVFNFDEINLPIFPFMICAFCILSKKSLPTPKAVEIFFSNFFSLSFMFRPMIRFRFVSACNMM